MSRRTPPTYDEIVARTVIEPDGSFQPTPQQLRDTHEGKFAMSDEERALAAKIDEALIEHGIDDVAFEVDRTRVILRGALRDPYLLCAIEEIVRGIDGVETIDNRLHIEAAST